MTTDEYSLPKLDYKIPTWGPNRIEPFPFEAFAKIVGGSNWVLARRTPRIVRQYGEDVVCLSSQRYRDAERVAMLLQTEGYD